MNFPYFSLVVIFALKSILPSSVINCPKAKIMTLILTLWKMKECCCLWFVCVAVLFGWVQMSLDPVCLVTAHLDLQTNRIMVSLPEVLRALGSFILCVLQHQHYKLPQDLCPHQWSFSFYSLSALSLSLSWLGVGMGWWGTLFTVFKFCLFSPLL